MGLGTGATALIAGGIGAAGSVASGVIGSKAATSAANAGASSADYAATLQKQAADEALAFQKQQYSDSQRNIAPWLQAGQGGLFSLANLLGIRMPSQQPVTASTNANGTGTVPRTDIGGIDRSSFAPSGGGNPLASDPSLGPLSGSMVGRGIPLRSLMVAGGDGTAAMPFSATGGQLPINPANGMAFNGNGLVNGGINPGSNATAAPGTLPNPDIGTFNAGTGSPIVANGSPGMVPRTDGGATAAAGSPATGTPPGFFDPNDPANFASLLQDFPGGPFSAPTDVTEQNDPGYKFRLDQGQQALENSAAARGGLLSGGTAKALQQYGQGFASNEYANVYNRRLTEYQQAYNQFKQNQTDRFNKLAAISGVGQTAAGQLSASGLTSANNISNILTGTASNIGQDAQNAAAARGSGYVGSANAITGGINSGISSLGGTLSLLALLNKGNPSSTPSTAGYGVY